jgi:hypothetical protein
VYPQVLVADNDMLIGLGIENVVATTVLSTDTTKSFDHASAGDIQYTEDEPIALLGDS